MSFMAPFTLPAAPFTCSRSMSFSCALETAGKRLHTMYVPPTLLCFLECIQQIKNEIDGRSTVSWAPFGHRLRGRADRQDKGKAARAQRGYFLETPEHQDNGDEHHLTTEGH
jgi:hypothetical protein